MTAPRSTATTSRRTLAYATLQRGLAFSALWFALSGSTVSELTLAGPLAVVVATWLSLHLLPPRGSRGSLRAAAQLFARFGPHSVIAGVDVARRAIDPRLPLRPDIVAFRSKIAPGSSRSAFCTLLSLQPGTLPVGEDGNGALVIHCLDVGQPVVPQLEREEVLLARALGAAQS